MIIEASAAVLLAPHLWGDIQRMEGTTHVVALI
jgi:hypothetical protein